MTTNLKKNLAPLLVVLGLVLLILGGALNNFNFNLFGSKAQADPKPACTTSNVYYATKAPVGSNDFGPNQTSHDLATVSKRFESKLQACGGDSLFTTTTVAFWQQGFSLDAGIVEANAKTFEADKPTWTAATKTFTSNVANYTAGYDPRDYQTLGMVPHGSKLPSLVRSTQHVKVGWALYVHMKDGSVLEFRIFCDFQEVGHFKHVPTVQHPVPPKKTPTGHRTQPPSSTPSSTHHTTVCTSGPNKGQPIPSNGICPVGKHVSQRPTPTGGPVVTCKGGYLDRYTHHCVYHSYSPPAQPSSTPRPIHSGTGPTIAPPTEPAAPPSDTTIHTSMPPTHGP